MNNEQYWKNFNLGIELQLSGNLIYDGLYFFDQLENFRNEEDIFEFLYLISVGIERLSKVAVVLIEHELYSEQEKLEKSLITHNHLELCHRIKKNRDLNLASIHNEFLQLLSTFYKTFRYDRFSLNDFREFDKEKRALIGFLEKHLDVEVEEQYFKLSPNDLRYKKFIGKVIGKITKQLFSIITSEASRLNIYTYEIRPYSKSYKIFLEEKYTFEKERLLQKEILLFLLKNDLGATGFKNHINRIESLDFQNGSENAYSQCLFQPLKCREFVDELDVLYEDIEDKKYRLGAMEVIGEENIYFEEDIEEDIEEDF